MGTRGRIDEMCLRSRALCFVCTLLDTLEMLAMVLFYSKRIFPDPMDVINNGIDIYSFDLGILHICMFDIIFVLCAFHFVMTLCISTMHYVYFVVYGVRYLLGTDEFFICDGRAPHWGINHNSSY